MKRVGRKIGPVFLFSLLLLFFINSSAYGFTIHGIEGKVKTRTFRIGGTTYVPLIKVCHAFGVDWEWDSVTRKVTLFKDGSVLSLFVGSEIILKDGRISYIKNPVKLYKGIVLVPKGFIYEDWWLKVPIAKPRVYRIETIVIDPGHGGRDPGACGRGGLKEKDVVLDISKRLKRILDSNGLRTVLTRSSDKFVSLWRRSRIANKARADFFISIHTNGYRSRRVSGFEVYYLSEATDDHARAVAAAENAALGQEVALFEATADPLAIQNPTLWDMILKEYRKESTELSEALLKAMDRRIRSRNRGVKSAIFYVLKGVRMPAVLVEVGFITNPTEEANFKSASYRQKIAFALAEGILAYKREYERTNGFTN